MARARKKEEAPPEQQEVQVLDEGLWLPSAVVQTKLGLGERSLQRLADAGELRTRKMLGDRRPWYHAGDAQRVKVERIPVTAPKHAAKPQTAPQQLLLPPELTDALKDLAVALKTPLLPPPERKEPKKIPAKLYIGMKAAVDYSGIPRKELVKEIEAGRLDAKGRKCGKGILYLVRRRSLERLVWK